MSKPYNFSKISSYFLNRVLLVMLVSAVIGSAVALFLVWLHWAIHFRFGHTWLLYLLPVAGVAIHFAYKLFGRSSEKGNNLIIDEIHQPGAGVPPRMGPLILVTTIITHLFGGSAGREGTAVQIGGSIAAWVAGLFKLNQADTRTLLTAGIAAGFGAVFGTPITGAVFAIEVLSIGRITYKPLLPCLIAGFAGDLTVSAWQVKHTAYHIGLVPQAAFSPVNMDAYGLLIVQVIAASALFGLASAAFAFCAHGIKNAFVQWFKISWFIPVLGGLIIIGLTWIIGKPDYLSLGVDPEHPGAVTIVSAFAKGGADTFSWFWKLAYTTITLGTGFKGGEVTPLFYIGATLGNTLATLMNAPVSLFAALGFIAVFAGATNTPVACTIMGMELFGPQYALFFAVACFTAYLCSGHGGIYSAQHRTDTFENKAYLHRKFWKYQTGTTLNKDGL